MKKHLVALGLAGAAVLTFGGASVFAMAQGLGPGTRSGSNGYAAMQAMHNSPAMAQFSPQLRAQCNTMHAQMSSQMNGATGSGMMGGR